MNSNQPKLTKFEMHLIMSMLRAGETNWLKIYKEIEEIRNNTANKPSQESKKHKQPHCS